MMRGISGIVVAILLVLIGISLVTTLYIWSTNALSNVYPDEQLNTEYLRSRACMSLESINASAGTAILRNCGFVPLKNLTMYVDGSAVDFSYPDSLEPSGKTDIVFDIPANGSHTYLAVADLAETPLMTASN